MQVRNVADKGRGFFALKTFKTGEFICEYMGELINAQEARIREQEYEKDPKIGSYMLFFTFCSQKFCIDATAESNSLGRLLNHSETRRPQQQEPQQFQPNRRNGRFLNRQQQWQQRHQQKRQQ